MVAFPVSCLAAGMTFLSPARCCSSPAPAVKADTATFNCKGLHPQLSCQIPARDRCRENCALPRIPIPGAGSEYLSSSSSVRSGDANNAAGISYIMARKNSMVSNRTGRKNRKATTIRPGSLAIRASAAARPAIFSNTLDPDGCEPGGFREARHSAASLESPSHSVSLVA